MHCRHNTTCAVDIILYPQLGCIPSITISNSSLIEEVAQKTSQMIMQPNRVLTLSVRGRTFFRERAHSNKNHER